MQQSWHGGDERLASRRLRGRNHALRVTGFDDLSGVHDGYPMRQGANTPRSCEIKRYADVLASLQIVEQGEDIAPDRHVERRDRFIENDQRRLCCDGARDRHTLALASRNLVN